MEEQDQAVRFGRREKGFLAKTTSREGRMEAGMAEPPDITNFPGSLTAFPHRGFPRPLPNGAVLTWLCRAPIVSPLNFPETHRAAEAHSRQ
jgi:hypothetical protein